VYSASTSVQKCKDCSSVLTDDFTKVEGQPITDQYEPEDKESLVSVYNDILRMAPPLEPNKNPLVQLDEQIKGKRHVSSKDRIEEKLREFRSMLSREISSRMDKLWDKI